MFFLGFFFAAVYLLSGCCCSLDWSTRSSNIKLLYIKIAITCCIITPYCFTSRPTSFHRQKREQNSFIFENFYFQLKLRWLFVAVRTSLFLFTLSSRMRPSHEILYEKMALIVKNPEKKNPRLKLNIKIRNPVLSAMIDQCEGDETGEFDLLLVSWSFTYTHWPSSFIRAHLSRQPDGRLCVYICSRLQLIFWFEQNHCSACVRVV